MIEYNDSYKLEQGPSFAVAEKTFLEKEPQTHTWLHYHSDVELLFIDEGSTNMYVAGHEFKADKGSLIIVNPYEVHSGETLGGKYRHRCICFDMGQIGLALTADKGYINHIENTECLKEYYTLCYDAVKKRFDGWEMMAKGSLLILFSLLNDKIVSNVRTREQKFSHTVLEYIYEHYGDDVTSRKIAEKLGYDHSYFCRKFKSLFSKKFSDFLNGYRISKAKEMLKEKSVSDTAISCGFQNISYFSRVFTKITGENPSRYKSKCTVN